MVINMQKKRNKKWVHSFDQSLEFPAVQTRSRGDCIPGLAITPKIQMKLSMNKLTHGDTVEKF